MAIKASVGFVLSLLVSLVLAGCGLGEEESITAKADADKVAMADAQDPAMLEAFARAGATLEDFLARIAAKDPIVQEPLVKLKVQDGDKVEYFWIDSPTQVEGGFSGVVRNAPEVVHNVEDGQVITFPRTQIFDWMYTDSRSGKMIGNYTACALLSHEKPGAAAEFRRTYRLDCDP
jgi:uncharacterized protein YegJ (DUF2314 family)